MRYPLRYQPATAATSTEVVSNSRGLCPLTCVLRTDRYDDFDTSTVAGPVGLPDDR